MAGDSESRFGFLAGFIACVLILTLTLMAFAPGTAAPVFEAVSFEPIQVEMPKPSLPLPTDAPRFAISQTV